MHFYTEAILDKAYRAACADGSIESNRARVSFIGHKEAGKTSLERRLLGKPFKKDQQSTEGIATHLIKSELYSGGRKTKIWTETYDNTEEVEKRFLKAVSSEVQHVLESGKKTSSAIELSTSKQHTTPITSTFDPGTIVHQPSIPNKKQQDTKPHTQDITPSVSEFTPVSSLDPDLAKQRLEMTTKGISKSGRRKLQNLMKSGETKAREKSSYWLRLWDFGGQTEFYATHHLFLDAESVNIIVMDITKDFKKPLQTNAEEDISTMGIPSTPEEFLHYWLNSIHTSAAEKHVQPSVALVLTHKDMIQSDDPTEYTEDYIQNIFTSLHTKPYATYVSREEIHVVDNTNKKKSDYNNIRQKIFKKIVTQRSWGMKRPA